MGMYTECFVNCSLKHDTPDEVINTLRSMFDEDYDGLDPDTAMPFPGDRGWMIGRCCSFYFQPEATSRMYRSEISNQWYILSRSDLKNYDGEIEHFFHWLAPYVDHPPGEFIGYIRYEEDPQPTLVLAPAGYNGLPNFIVPPETTDD